ncbi:hypothetical protein D3C83_98400 [compost metagenome]
MPDARNHDSTGAAQFAWHGGRPHRRVQGGEGLSHRRQVAGAVIDERDHNSPFVLGSIFASRASFAQATRSARANALNTASTR